ncbi:hypothetical protein PU560_07670, partial [Georgenia sp. 10Sc9-8]|nr:hypothetical protein [Georgenia halotolerans]
MPFRLTVTESFSITGRGLVVTGVVDGGPVQVDQKVWVRPPSGNDRIVVVAGITVDRRNVPRAEPGDEAGLLLHGVKPLILGPDGGIPPGSVLETVAVSPDPDPEPGPDLDDLKLDERPTALPLLLLPLRLETSFHGTTLRIRAFPDQVHVDSHDPRLTDDEVAAGRAYLRARSAGTPPDEVRTDLESTLGPARAAVVAERADADGEAGLRAEAAGALDRRAVARGLPHKLIAHGRSGRRTFTAEGRPIPAEVPIAPADGDTTRPGTGGPLDWMVDYAAAERLGLALTMQLDDAAATDGLDRLYVVGLDADEDGHHRFAELVHAHARTDGAATLAPLTSTKGSPQNPPPWADDGGTAPRRLGRALGLTEDLTLTRPPAPDPGTLTGDLASIVWEAALRPALGELYGARPDVLDRARDIFVHRIHPFGPYVTLQLGDQPYATAPVLARTRQRGDADLGAVGEAIRAALPTVAATAEATRADVRSGGGYPWMLDTLQRSPVGQQWRLRTLTAAEAYLTPLARGAGSAAATTVSDALFGALRAGRNLLTELGLRVDGDARVVSAIGDGATPLVCGPLVAPGAAEDHRGAPVADAGIEQLLTDPEFWALRMKQVEHEDTPTDTEPEPLLRLLAENAVLLALADLAQAEDLAGSDSALADLLATGEAVLPDKVVRLRARLAAAAERTTDGGLTGLVRTLRPRTREGAARLRHLQELVTALTRVNAGPAGAVHAALAAVLDCVATRADAWLVAEAEDALAADRRAGRDGVALGAWGMVQDVRPGAGQAPTRHGSAPSQELATTLGLLHRARRGLAGTGLDAAVRADLSGPRVAEAREILALLAQGRPIDAALSRRVAEKLNAAGRGPVMTAV